VGPGALLARAGPGLDKVLDVGHASSWKLALRDVRQGDDDAAVEQIGPLLVVHYSIADPTTAGLVQTIFASIVGEANKALVKANRGYLLLMQDVMARGEGPAAALPDIGILLLLTAVLCLISVRVFRWDEI